MFGFLYGVACVVVSGVFTLYCPEDRKGVVLSVGTGLGAVLMIRAVFPVLMGAPPLSWAFTIKALPGQIALVIDPLAAFFVLLIAGMSLLSVMYGNGYLRVYQGQGRTFSSHYLFFSLLIASMLLVVTVQHVVAFLIAWEIMSLSSFFLVLFEHEKEDVLKAGLNYLIAMHVGVCFLISGFGLLSAQAGSFEFAAFAPTMKSQPAFASLVFLLLCVGFGMKAGFLPLHTWLPQAHPAAPSHVSGMMSGIMIKTGIYGIVRILTLFQSPPLWLSVGITVMALCSAVYGVLYAIAQRDLKKALAYSSVENIGLIGLGLGIGMAGLSTQNTLLAACGFAGGLLHVLNHAIFKMLLFFSAGAVYQQTHTRNIEQLGGLIHRMTTTALCFLIGSVAICGLPLGNGFISEILLYLGLFRGVTSPILPLALLALIGIMLLALIGVLALLCFSRLFGMVSLGSPRSAHAQQAKEVDAAMLLPMSLLSLFALLIGLFPQYAVRLVIRPVFTLVPGVSAADFAFLTVLSKLSWVGFGFLLVCAMLYAARRWLLQKQSVYAYKTWDCGYQAGNTRMQFTGSSYAEPLLELVEPVVHTKRHVERPTGLFPQQAHFESQTHDLVDRYAVQPMIAGINRLLGWFTWIQSGSTQKYILYGIIFLAITLAVVLGI